jgi:hypothetical protein
MTIKVLVKCIENESITKILEYYNSNKSTYDEPLEPLDRAEGGFQIKFSDVTNIKNVHCDPNEKIKQLRWSRGYLVPYSYYMSFTILEERLLFEAMKNVLGEDVQDGNKVSHNDISISFDC